MFADSHFGVKDRCVFGARHEELYVEFAPVFGDWLRKASEEDEKKKNLYKSIAEKNLYTSIEAFVREGQKRDDIKLIRGEPTPEDEPKKD
jgi:hypothetical protein